MWGELLGDWNWQETEANMFSFTDETTSSHRFPPASLKRAHTPMSTSIALFWSSLQTNLSG